MKRKKFLKILAASAFMLTGIGVISHASIGETPQDIAYAEDGEVQGTYAKIIISNEGFVKQWNWSGFTGASSVNIASGSVDNGAVYKGTSGSNIKIKVDPSKGNYISWKGASSVWFELPACSSGTVAITVSSSSDSRYLACEDNDTLKLWSKLGTDGTSKGPQSFTFSSTDLYLDETTSTTYLRLKDNSTEMKLSSLTITLDSDLKENFNGVTAEKFTVSFFDKITDENGTTTDVEYVDYRLEDVIDGTAVSAPSNPEKVGYEFDKWVDSSGAEYDFTSPVTADISLYASWTAVSTHTITITDYEGATPRSLTVNDGDALVIDDPEAREGYEFLGWYTTSTFDEGSEVTSETIVTADMSIYGKWGSATYVYVTFIVEGETLEGEYRTIEGHTLDNWPSDPVVSGSAFYGWYDEDGNAYTSDSVINGNITLTAKIDVILVQTYNLSDFATANNPVDESTNYDLTIEENVVKVTGFNKVASKSATVESVSYTKALQAQGVELNLAYNAEVTIIAAQTGNNKTRRFAVIDQDGFKHHTTFDLGSGQTAQALTFTLKAGVNKIYGYDYSTYAENSSFNFFSVKIDYTNRDSLTSFATDGQGFKLSSQAGYAADNSKSMRFVGEMDFTAVTDVTSILITPTITKTVEGVDSSEALTSEFIYTVYDRVTLSDEANAKFGVKENRLYFYYIIDSIGEDYKSVSCNVKVTLASGDVYSLTNEFDCVSAFVA